MAAARQNRHGHRDATMILIAFRHGLRASEPVDLRWDQVDFARAVLHVRRVKQGTPSIHPLRGGIARPAPASTREQAQPVRVHQRAGCTVHHCRVRPHDRAGSVSCRPRVQGTRTCSGTPAASRSPMRATIRAPCKPISGTGIFSTRSATPSWHPTGSRISGGTDPPDLVMDRSAPKHPDDAKRYQGTISITSQCNPHNGSLSWTRKYWLGTEACATAQKKPCTRPLRGMRQQRLPGKVSIAQDLRNNQASVS